MPKVIITVFYVHCHMIIFVFIYEKICFESCTKFIFYLLYNAIKMNTKIIKTEVLYEVIAK